mgnify:CR=1 FL=1
MASPIQHQTPNDATEDVDTTPRVLDGDLSKHEQAKARLIETLADLQIGDKLLPERELAAQFGISRMTLRQAISGLARAGYVSRVPGAGTFVAKPTISKTSELTGFSEDMAARGFTASSRLVAFDTIVADSSACRDLMLEPGEMLVHIERVRMADGVPMCIERIDLPALCVVGLTADDLKFSLYEILASRYGIKLIQAEQTISASVVDQEQATLLSVPSFSPALIVERLGYDQRTRPIERARSIYRGDRYDIRTTVRRDSE